MSLTNKELDNLKNLINKTNLRKPLDNQNKDSYYQDADENGYIVDYSSDSINEIKSIQEKLLLNISDDEQNIIMYIMALSKKYISESEYLSTVHNSNSKDSDLPDFIYNF